MVVVVVVVVVSQLESPWRTSTVCSTGYDLGKSRARQIGRS